VESKSKMKSVRNLTFGLVLLFIGFSGCSTGPEPLRYGTDICYTCKMTLVDQKFGAELVTRKGKVYKFDDLNCFFNFYHSNYEEIDEFTHQLVIDYSHPGTLVEAKDAFYLKSNELRTPMASEVAVFKSKQSLDSIKKQTKGVFLVWGEIITQFK
jgi:copper chaperone NosL